MKIIEALENNGFKTTKKTLTEYSSACPGCGGTDRFVITPGKGKSGKAWCRQGDWSGDGIQLLRDFFKYSYYEACDFFGIAVKTKTRKQIRAVSPALDKKKEGQEIFTPRETVIPSTTWQQKTSLFADNCYKRLLHNNNILKYLAGRGIKLKSVKYFGLGYCPEDYFRDRKNFDMPAGPKLYFPRGIVIPAFSQNGLVNRLRIRCEELKRPKDPRYRMVAGSCSSPAIIPCKDKNRPLILILVESELDAILIYQEAGDLITSVSMGNSTSHPDKATESIFKNAKLILNALDHDQAGAKAALWWGKHFPQTKRWSTPDAGDPGEYYEEGGNIRNWILAGLPIGYHPQEKTITIHKGYSCGPSEATILQSKTVKVKKEVMEVPEGVDVQGLNKIFGGPGRYLSLIKKECKYDGCKSIVFVGTFNDTTPPGDCGKHTSYKLIRKGVNL